MPLRGAENECSCPLFLPLSQHTGLMAVSLWPWGQAVWSPPCPCLPPAAGSHCPGPEVDGTSFSPNRQLPLPSQCQAGHSLTLACCVWGSPPRAASSSPRALLCRWASPVIYPLTPSWACVLGGQRGLVLRLLGWALLSPEGHQILCPCLPGLRGGQGGPFLLQHFPALCLAAFPRWLGLRPAPPSLPQAACGDSHGPL